MRHYLVIGVMCLTACGKAPAEYSGFELEVESFINEAESRGLYLDYSNVKVTLAEEVSDKPTTVATCETFSKQINIKRSYWDKATPVKRELLVFHELGHCVLKQTKHVTCPNVMCSSIDGTNSIDYTTNRQYYLNVMFNKAVETE